MTGPEKLGRAPPCFRADLVNVVRNAAQARSQGPIRVEISAWAADELLTLEYKNWSKPVGHPEVTRLVDRLRRHHACGHVGLLVAMNGFTEPAMEEIRNIQRENLWVIPLNAGAVDALVQSEARGEALRRHFDRSVLS